MKRLSSIVSLLSLLLFAGCNDNDYKASVKELRLVLVKPVNVNVGDIATILGRNFSTVAQENKVSINGVQATVIESSTDEMKIIMPNVTPGKYPIKVTTPSGELEGLEVVFLKIPDHEYLVQTIVGQKGKYDMVDGIGTQATTKLPTGLAFAPDGSIWFTERGLSYIRRIAPDLTVSTLKSVGVSGSAIWQGGFDSKGNYYFVDKAKGWLRKLDANTMELSTLATGMKSPMNVAFDAQDNIYVAARDDKAVYKFTPAGDKSTYAELTVNPNYIVFDKKGSMIIATSKQFVLVQVAPDGTQTTIAGDGVKGELYDGTSGNPLTAKIGVSFGVAAACDGCLYISDNTYHCIRKLTPDASGDYSKGTLETIAGTGKSGYADGKGLKASFNAPYEIIVSQDCKTMYVAGAVNYLIRRITVK